jgi:hypothetical protein
VVKVEDEGEVDSEGGMKTVGRPLLPYIRLAFPFIGSHDHPYGQPPAQLGVSALAAKPVQPCVVGFCVVAQLIHVAPRVDFIIGHL